MDNILNLIKNSTIFNNFNFQKKIEKIIINDIDYNIIINEFNDNKKNEIYIGEIDENNKLNGNGILILNQFILIRGNFDTKENITNSHIYINNELFCKGDLINGKLNNKCIVYYNNIIVYSGILENNIPNDNNCLFTFINKNKYTGMIINGVIEGTGIMIYSKDVKYEGEWLNNKRHGKGILYDNEIIEGNWFNDKKFGIMKIVYKSLVKYKEYNNNGEIIKEYTYEEYTIKNLNDQKKQMVYNYDIQIKKNKQDYENNIKNININNEKEIVKIKQLCEKQIKNIEKDYEKKLSENYESRLCKICYTNIADMVLDTCSHISLCKNCETNMRRTSRHPKCPICRINYYRGKQIIYS